VERGLVPIPGLWRWSTYRTFAGLEQGPVKLNWQTDAANPKRETVSQGDIAAGLFAHPSNRMSSTGTPCSNEKGNLR